MKPTTRDFPLPQGFSPDAALRSLANGPRDPSTSVGTRFGTWLAFHTPEGPVTVRVIRQANRAVIGAWGPGAEWAACRGDRLLGLTDDWADFDHPEFTARLPAALAAVRRQKPHLAAPATGRIWPTLFASVLGQKITFMEAQYAFRRLTELFGEPAPGAGTGVAPPWLRMAPTPQAVRGIPSWQWHAARVDWSRATTAMEASRASGLERLAELSEEEAYLRLQHLPGVGPWTAAETVQRSHAAKDAVSVGDFHLAHIVGEALTGRRTDDDGMLALVAPYAGQRHRVVRVILASGFTKQAFGPKLAPEDHRFR